MNAKGRKIVERERRQAILDYLNRTKEAASIHTLMIVTGETDKAPIRARMKQMQDQREVAVTTRLCKGYNTNFYTANVATTAERYPPRKWGEKKIEQKPRSTAGHIRNYCDDSKPPLRDQRGQGCAYSVSRGFSTLHTLE